jgi:hypothetical protein
MADLQDEEVQEVGTQQDTPIYIIASVVIS